MATHFPRLLGIMKCGTEWYLITDREFFSLKVWRPSVLWGLRARLPHKLAHPLGWTHLRILGISIAWTPCPGYHAQTTFS